MSPPCQPYTRTGLHRGSEDIRSKSFIYLVDLLAKMNNPPTYILIENVKGFEESETRATLIKQLINCNYNYQEFFITPLQLGIPNSRLRYYMLAKKQPLAFKTSDNSKILNHIPCSLYDQDFVDIRNTNDSKLIEKKIIDSKLKIVPIEKYLKIVDDDDRYSIPSKVLLKYGKLFDIVKPSSTRSCCFTKGYYHYVEGTGSILQMNEELDVNLFLVFVFIAQQLSNNDMLASLSLLRLRYFTEQEISQIMGFPKEFLFPDEITLKQRYRVLGNSININVVSELIKYLLLD
ncbi:S-adenosyl-L-methionine-dependent methyltransferase [Gigaspora rosea]|uniref:tRNA (cytosine(38)-C(5))-methyltransferase n=1 Tax=Gigaspora rosea TaxID=44941 RepID=A0A397VSV5_9GLOM|nr:S-adenosyl-L-methionine-dependent methyltransferase [Gigaspora rosea]